jgi:hypothetical protein
MPAILPPKGRDLRLDFFRGIANWAIFLDHIPNNAVNWITTRNWGFSDSADMFVFISGYTAAFVYARVMLERGTIEASTRILKRAWQIYVAHVFLFVIYIAEIGYLAQTYDNPVLAQEFNVFGFLRYPIDTLYQGLILKFKPVNLDVLPLYIVLMVAFPPVLWSMLRKPDLTLLASVIVYVAARHFGWNLPSYPGGHWYFNPFAWQLLFVFGGWCALGGAQRSVALIKSRAMLIFGVAYLLFALFMTMAGRFPSLAELVPSWLDHAVNPISKTNLDPLRFVHFVILAILVVRILPRDWPALRPAITRGFLLRRLLVVRRAFHTGADIERDLDANPGEHRRNRSDDGLGILSLLVQGDGQTPFKAGARGGAEAGGLKRAHRSPEDCAGIRPASGQTTH